MCICADAQMALIFHPKSYGGEEESPAELICWQGIPKDGMNWCKSVMGRNWGVEREGSRC